MEKTETERNVYTEWERARKCKWKICWITYGISILTSFPYWHGNLNRFVVFFPSLLHMKLNQKSETITCTLEWEKRTDERMKCMMNEWKEKPTKNIMFCSFRCRNRLDKKSRFNVRNEWWNECIKSGYCHDREIISRKFSSFD